VSGPADLGYPEKFRFDSSWIGLRLWREPKRRMSLEPIIRQGETYHFEGGYTRSPDKLIGYWVKFEGLFPKRLDELVGETTTFEFRVSFDGVTWVRWFFESVTWMEGWDQEEQRPCIVGHAEPHRGPSRSQHVREQIPEAEESIAAWWTETS
jgi:hypothetical protein